MCGVKNLNLPGYCVNTVMKISVAGVLCSYHIEDIGCKRYLIMYYSTVKTFSNLFSKIYQNIYKFPSDIIFVNIYE